MADIDPKIFNHTANLAHLVAQEQDLTWREQVHLEAALNNLYLDLSRPDMKKFCEAMRKFFDDISENVT